jgi:hypothetical protein
MTRIQIAFAAALALILAACGGNPERSSGRIGPEGGTLTAGTVTLTVPAGAVSQPTDFSLRQAAPRADAVIRVDVEPRGLQLRTAAVVSVRSDDAARLKLVEIENEVEHGLEFERHNQAEHTREAVVSRLGTFEARHAAVCLAGCAAGLECDDGVCKAHGADDGGVTPGAGGTCPAGWELDASDGTCKPHGGAAGGTPPVGGACPDGQELDASDGICKPHGGSGGGSGKGN